MSDGADTRFGADDQIARSPRGDTLRVELLLFAQVAEAAGARRLQLSLPAGATVAGIWNAVAEGAPAIAAALAPWRGRVAVARNERYARDSDLLRDGDVLALIPPVSGG